MTDFMPITVQGHNWNDWATEICENLEDFETHIRYLRRCGRGNVTFWINGIEVDCMPVDKLKLLMIGHKEGEE